MSKKINRAAKLSGVGPETFSRQMKRLCDYTDINRLTSKQIAGIIVAMSRAYDAGHTAGYNENDWILKKYERIYGNAVHVH